MQTDALCAAKRFSTAPGYVLVTVVNIKSRERFVSAVESTTLHAALAAEHGITRDFSQSYFQAIRQLIDKHLDLTFAMSSEAAIGQLRPDYSESMLNEARRAFASLDDEQLLEAFASHEARDRLYDRTGGGKFWERQRAIAHVLLERGFFVGRGDYVPALRVSKKKDTKCSP